MNVIIENWYLIIAGIAAIVALVAIVVRFFKLPTKKQEERIIEWLIFATLQAEEAFGSKTGSLKLRSVYDGFISKFPWISKLISFEKFSDLVDEALVVVRAMLEGNSAIADIIKKK